MTCKHKWNLTTNIIKKVTPMSLARNSIRTCLLCGKTQTFIMEEDTSKAPGNYIIMGWR